MNRSAFPSAAVVGLAAVALLLGSSTIPPLAFQAHKAAKRPVPPKQAAVAAKRVGKPIVVVIAARQPAKDETGRALKVGDRLPVGAAVRTGKGARLTLITRRGSEYTLNAGAELLLKSRDTAALRRGEIYCRSRTGEIKLVNTAAGKIHLLGTVIDATAQDGRKVGVTVVSGKVRLSNAHGQALVPAGRRSLLVASALPTVGVPVNTFAATAWYDGRGAVLSDFGDIAYTIQRSARLLTEVWAMRADGTNKRRLKSYLTGYCLPTAGPWWPGQQWLLARTDSLVLGLPPLEDTVPLHGMKRIVDDQTWLLDAASGQDVPFQPPAGYHASHMEISPDATRLAFSGSYWPNHQDRKTWQGGVWVYDLQTGDLRKLLDGPFGTPVAWAPDSRRIVTAIGDPGWDYEPVILGYDTGKGTHYPLTVVDTETGEVTDLGEEGVEARFSPDGARIAYISDFEQWAEDGRPIDGTIYVLDLEPGNQPRFVSTMGKGASRPRWSPDGTRVAYRTFYLLPREQSSDGYGAYGCAVFVASADGSGAKKVYDAAYAVIQTLAWAPSGDALYLPTHDGVLLFAADGSGLRANLGGNEKDSVLPPAYSAQTAGAMAAAQEAGRQYAAGDVRAFEGRVADARAAFQAAADAFAALPWQYPLAGLSTSDALRYADKAATMARRSPEAVLTETCRLRIGYAGTLLIDYAAEAGRFAPDLASLEEWAQTHNWHGDVESAKMSLRCPSGHPFIYTAPPAGQDPKIGDVLFACPAGHRWRSVWNKAQAERLASERRWVAKRRSERKNAEGQ